MYLVWGQLSLDEIRLQTSSTGQHEIPWYLYFIKLGTNGLLGIALVLSYFFRRFDHRIFVFGIISVIALFAGSYYDEHRFSKYVMLGMAGFASLMIYEIMQIIFKHKSSLSSLYISVIIPVVVTSSALSVLLFASYTYLALENNYTPYLNNQGGKYLSYYF